MLSIRENTSTLVIKNSKFIGVSFQVHSLEDINNCLLRIKEMYKDATHYCYAYILDGSIKCSDDGEPSGTAGMPILDVLKKNDLNHVLVIVVRYFGKVKLGAGGLVRAYSNCTSLCIKDNIITLRNAFYVNLIFGYENVKIVDNIIDGYKVLNKDYSEKIMYTAIIDEKCLDNLRSINGIDIDIKDNTFI